ncbi:hypothetical protein METESE_02680 [Mesoterricola sediminis]|uniref:Glycosyltransferase n=1 Tax=Mesoterricola sediminis TaxID=2927980 RepID=A0AA48GTD8_9BACT|nr:hypothetical protein METESE_02680 [Mesoterricola sediminis]
MYFFNRMRAFERSWGRSVSRLLTGRSWRPPEPEPAEAARRLAWAEGALAGKGPGDGLRFALVGPLPPAATGIAHFGATYFQAPGWAPDVYAPGSLDSLAAQAERWPSARVLPLEALGAPGTLDADVACVLQMGNSAHHVETLAAFTRVRGAGGRRIVYLHDAQLVRLWTARFGSDPFRIRRFYREHYPDRTFGLMDLYMPQDAESATPRGIRPLVALTAPDLLVVNNAFCADLVRRDLDGWGGAPPIRQLFHPIPARPNGVQQPPRRRRVGHFGAIGNGKRIEVLLEAMGQVTAQEPATLVLAGYEVGRFAHRHGLDRLPWIEIHDSPPDDRLTALMESVDVGVQMRSQTQGESSGVVAQLLSLGRPVIVSRTGGFAELGDAVTMVDPEAGPREVAEALEAALRDPHDAKAGDVLRSHGLEAFHRAFEALLDAPGSGR